jgi:tetratricopeptide (TPR) repeat protein
MVRGWLAVLAVLAGVSLSFAADSTSPLLKEKQWEEARTALAEGKAAEAKAALEPLLAKYPEEPDLPYALALVALRLRDPDAAERSIRQTLALDPNHVQAWTLLGWIELEIHGNPDAAIKDYSKVIELRPNSPDAQLNLGAAYKKKGELTNALNAYDQALKIRPDYVVALSNRGWVFVEQQKWAEARKDFENALKINPADEGALQGLAEVLEKTRDYAGAQTALNNLMTRSPNFVYWLEWGRIGLIRYWWVWLLTAVAFYLKGRFYKTRSASNG